MNIRIRHPDGGLLIGLLMLLQAAAGSHPSLAMEALPVPGTGAGPEEIVNALENGLIAIMQADLHSPAERSNMLEPVVARVFDFERMSRFIFGPEWNRMPEQDHQRFLDAFLAYSCANYAHNFDSYNKEYFEAVNKEITDDKYARIRHRLVTRKQEVDFDYALTKTDAGWKIVNVLAKGVSDLAIKRTQFNQLFERGGLEATIDYLQEQTQRLRQP